MIIIYNSQEIQNGPRPPEKKHRKREKEFS